MSVAFVHHASLPHHGAGASTNIEAGSTPFSHGESASATDYGGLDSNFPIKEHLYITKPMLPASPPESDSDGDSSAGAASPAATSPHVTGATQAERLQGPWIPAEVTNGRTRKLSAPREHRLSQAVFSPEQLRDMARQHRRTGSKGSLASIATMSSVVTTGNSVYEDAVESHSLTSDEDGDSNEDEDSRGSLSAIKNLDLIIEPTTPPRAAKYLEGQAQSPLMSPPFLSPFASEDPETRRLAKLSMRRASLQAEYGGSNASPTSPQPSSPASVIPLRRNAAGPDSPSTPSRRDSTFSANGDSASTMRYDRRASFQLKPLVLTPQRTVIAPPLYSPKSPTYRRLSTDYSTSSLHSDSPSSNRALSPGSFGPLRRRSMGYIDNTAMTASLARMSADPVSATGPRALDQQWVAEREEKLAGPQKLPAVQSQGSHQLETIPGTPQISLSEDLASGRFDSASQSVPMDRSDLSVSSSYSTIESSAPPSPPNFPLPPAQAPSRKSSFHSLRTTRAPSPPLPPIETLPAPRRKKRIPAPYDEHWNGEAFIEVDDMSPVLGQAELPGVTSQTAAVPALASGTGRPSTIEPPKANPTAAQPDSSRRASTTYKPIVITPQNDRRASVGTLRKKRPESIALARNEQSAAPASRRNSILNHARSFAFERLDREGRAERRLSKSIENLRSPQTESNLAAWPPAHGEQTKKLSAGPPLTAFEIFPDEDMADPPSPGTRHADEFDERGYRRGSSYAYLPRRPSLEPRDPRAQVIAPDSFLGVLLTTEPPVPRERRETLASILSTGTHNRWSSHSSSTTGTATSAPSEYSTTPDSPKKGRFRARFFSLGSKSSSKKQRPNSTVGTISQASAPKSAIAFDKATVAPPRGGILIRPRPDSVSSSYKRPVSNASSNGWLPRLSPISPLTSSPAQPDSAPSRGPSRASFFHPLEPLQDEGEEETEITATDLHATPRYQPKSPDLSPKSSPKTINDKAALNAVLGNIVVNGTASQENRRSPIAIPPGGGRRASGSSSGTKTPTAGSRRGSADTTGKRRPISPPPALPAITSTVTTGHV